MAAPGRDSAPGDKPARIVTCDPGAGLYLRLEQFEVRENGELFLRALLTNRTGKRIRYFGSASLDLVWGAGLRSLSNNQEFRIGPPLRCIQRRLAVEDLDVGGSNVLTCLMASRDYYVRDAGGHEVSFAQMGAGEYEFGIDTEDALELFIPSDEDHPRGRVEKIVPTNVLKCTIDGGGRVVSWEKKGERKTGTRDTH